MFGDFAGLEAAITSRSARTEYPGFRFYENGDGLVLRAEIPGVHPEDIEVEVRNDILTATIEKRPEDVGGARPVRQERLSGRFSRSFQLPFRANEEAVKADYQNGVLLITVPRAEAEKPKKIPVQAG